VPTSTSERTSSTAPAARSKRTALVEFLSTETLGSVVLLGAVIGALVWANVSWASYVDVWSRELTIGIGSVAITESLAHWVTDGLMTLFFFVAGLEIKRELVRGELRNPRAAALPVIAALGGMLMPALLYSLLNAGGGGAHGWGIPMATDIAFAVAVLAALGSRVPRPLKLFVLTLAIVDDIGAIVVIAAFYSSGVSLAWLGGAVLAVGAMVLMRRAGVCRISAYVVPGIALWVCMLESGVHATIAGVVLGLLTPACMVRDRDVIQQLEHRLHPWCTFLVVPVFALASAGVALDATSLADAAASTASWGVVLGLAVGKPVGVLLGVLLALGVGVARLPNGVGLRHLIGAGMVAGIGFTVSLFVADLSFTGALLQEAKIGILAASIVSAALGAAFLATTARRSPGRLARAEEVSR
jgi:Na+:H+ antiporter, NhaA family